MSVLVEIDMIKRRMIIMKRNDKLYAKINLKKLVEPNWLSQLDNVYLKKIYITSNTCRQRHVSVCGFLYTVSCTFIRKKNYLNYFLALGMPHLSLRTCGN